MLAVEIEAPIIDHRLNIFSDLLPAQSRLAKIIVMYSEEQTEVPAQGVLSRLRANPAQIRGDGLPIKRDELYDRASLR
ncbi:MAG: hypothetical protein WC208_01315 [Gallionella sp.]|jgi:hypothetical protein